MASFPFFRDFRVNRKALLPLGDLYMQQRFWVMRIVLFAALLTICLVSFVLFEVSMHTAVHAAPRTRALPASSISNVLSSFYANPNDSGTFDIASTTTPVF